MKTKLCTAVPLIISAFQFFSVSAFSQGPLTPPGAPAPTMKTLDQVQPRTLIPGGTAGFTISSEGSYYLGGNLTVTSGFAITVGANNVTIDLQGFELIGTGGGNTGIFLNGGVSNVTIHNGTIRNFTSDGINGQGNSKVRVEKVRAFNNASSGIVVDVNGAVVDCVAEANAGPGIVGADNCVIHHCQSVSNTGTNSHGISVGNAAEISDCVLRSNAGAGLVVTSAGIVRDCVAVTNSGDGIQVNGTSTLVQNNNCVSNGGAGVHVTVSGALIVKNNATSNTGGDYNIAAGSNFGQILAFPGANFTSTAAWANFSSACIPTTCAAQMIQCGSASDGCGGTINCGACGAGQSCCIGACKNLSSDVNNCGSCGNACPFANNATTTCTGGVCSFTCNAGFGNCDGNNVNGCETNLLTNKSNCGSCGHVCPGVQNCVAGVCQ